MLKRITAAMRHTLLVASYHSKPGFSPTDRPSRSEAAALSQIALRHEPAPLAPTINRHRPGVFARRSPQAVLVCRVRRHASVVSREPKRLTTCSLLVTVGHQHH